eukprot:360082-Chlamydomonas_euryale.AAC.2
MSRQEGGREGRGERREGGAKGGREGKEEVWNEGGCGERREGGKEGGREGAHTLGSAGSVIILYVKLKGPGWAAVWWWWSCVVGSVSARRVLGQPVGAGSAWNRRDHSEKRVTFNSVQQICGARHVGVAGRCRAASVTSHYADHHSHQIHHSRLQASSPAMPAAAPPMRQTASLMHPGRLTRPDRLTHAPRSPRSRAQIASLKRQDRRAASLTRPDRCARRRAARSLTRTSRADTPT